MRFAIFGNNYQERSMRSIAALLDTLHGQGADIAVERRFHGYLQRALKTLPPCTPFAPDKPADADMAISIGGDGTFLSAAHSVAKMGMPIMGINAGHLGYLTTMSLDESAKLMPRIIAGEYKTERRTLLQASCDVPEALPELPFALNDITFVRNGTSSMISLETTVNGVPLTTFRGDGLVVCTPTGSTAYNMSSGGPIMEPTAACLALTPISPHSLTMRPLVVPDDATITVTVTSRARKFLVSIDGTAKLCPSKTTVTIKKAPFAVNLVQRLNHNFAVTLHNKLMWGTEAK